MQRQNQVIWKSETSDTLGGITITGIQNSDSYYKQSTLDNTDDTWLT